MRIFKSFTSQVETSTLKTTGAPSLSDALQGLEGRCSFKTKHTQTAVFIGEPVSWRRQGSNLACSACKLSPSCRTINVWVSHPEASEGASSLWLL